MKLNRVVITGLGSLTPIGNNTSEYWKNLLLGVSGAYPIQHFDASQYKTTFACEVKDFNILNWIEQKEARKMDLFTHYAIAAVDEAVKDAKMDLSSIDLEKVGVIFGTGMGGHTSLYEEIEKFLLDGVSIAQFSPFLLTKVIGNIAAGHKEIKYGFSGVYYATNQLCIIS